MSPTTSGLAALATALLLSACVAPGPLQLPPAPQPVHPRMQPQALQPVERPARRERPAAELPASQQPVQLGPAFQRPVTLEFRDAPLRAVLESLGRSNGVNFVFDREVRGDARVTVFLKDVSIDDAMKVILATQQLDRKLLNESTVLIYPNTSPKQREHQELVTRSFYLNSADVKQAQTLVRTIAKTRDMFVDERLNLLVVRDTPEVVRLAEKLIASLDIADPEVVLDVEVMEIGTNRLDELGVTWPEEIAYGLPGASGSVELGRHREFRATVANPALVATLRGTTNRANVLANPRLRARNREKAKVMIGEKLPVFTTTSTANVGVSASVAYLDVGLKLEVEPTVQLDGDVLMRVNLEVSTLIGRVAGPAGSVAYQVGQRQASTALRLRDGETQVLAGLIRDEDSKGVQGVPGLGSLPVVGRLFGVHTDQRTKTEIVLLITPRVVSHIEVPDAAVSNAPAGVDASPGAESLRLKRHAKVAMPLSPSGARGASEARAAAGAADGAASAMATLTLSTSGQVEPGGTVAVTLHNRSAAAMKGELEFDTRQLQSAQGADARTGRVPFRLAAGGEQVFMLRALPAAAGQQTSVSVVGLVADDPGAAATMIQVQGDGMVQVGGRAAR